MKTIVLITSPKLRRRLTLVGSCLLALACILFPSLAFGYADAAPTQDDVLRAISKNVDEPTNSGPMLVAILAIIGGLAIIFVLLSRREKREAVPRALVNHGKLLREILKAGLPLKAAEVKQLKLLAEFEALDENAEPPLSSPLTLLICPSVLIKRLKSPPPKLDRKVLAQVVKKLGARNSEVASQRA
jgi:hypothetical protein